MKNLIFVLLLVLMTGIIVFDVKGKISVTSKWNVWYTGFLIPHIFLLSVIGNEYISIWSLVLLVIYSLYCLVRINICPVLRDDSENIRLMIMSGGRTIAILGLTASLLQCIAYIAFWTVIEAQNIPDNILIIDGIITGAYVLLLLLNGVFRIILTSLCDPENRKRTQRRTCLP